MGRTIFVGDVHGCRAELTSLLSEVGLGTPGEDRVIFVGDLVDKGPDSIGALRDAQRILRTFPGSCVVAGNHEEKALRMFKSGKLDQFVDGHEDRAWVHEATEEDWAFIESMPLTWHNPKANIRVVHGGIFPALLEKHPDAFDKIEARGANWHKGGGKVMNRARRMLRVRYVNGEGDMLALGENQEGDPFWADVYDGSQGTVIFGHSPFLSGKARVFPHAIGIDTGCVFGSKLTAFVIDDDDGQDERGTFVQVDALRQHAIPLKED